MACADKASDSLSDQSFNFTKPIPKLLPAPLIKLRPLIKLASVTPSRSLIFAYNSLVTASVRSNDAPAGNSMLAKIIPLSSFGTNPVGVVVAAQ